MENIAEIIKNLSPEKRAQLLAKLGKGNAGKAAAQKTDFGSVENYAYNFRSARPFDFERAETTIDAPEPGMLQMEVRAVSLNFRDLMIALGLYPASPGVPTNMGSDYSGVVIKVGEGVEGYKEGDEVIGLSIGHFENGSVRENCHFMKRINIPVNCVAPKPKALDHIQACCIPTVFLTSYVGLVHMARLSKEDTLLLHTATGGVGLAAIQIAKWIGAHIYATAGSESKRQYLDTLNIHNAMDSRSLAFELQVMEMTKGAGIDVVLNTLSADAVEAGLRLLKPFGRFIHIDKKDIAANRPLLMGELQKSISFSFLDISLLFRQQELMQSQLRQIVGHFDSGHFQPINFKTYPMADVKKALNDFSHATHIGKLVMVYD